MWLPRSQPKPKPCPCPYPLNGPVGHDRASRKQTQPRLLSVAGRFDTPPPSQLPSIFLQGGAPLTFFRNPPPQRREKQTRQYKYILCPESTQNTGRQSDGMHLYLHTTQINLLHPRPVLVMRGYPSEKNTKKTHTHTQTPKRTRYHPFPPRTIGRPPDARRTAPGDGHRVDHLLGQRRVRDGDVRALALPLRPMDRRLRPKHRNIQL